MPDARRILILNQIRAYQYEITVINAVFAIVNCLSYFFLKTIFFRLYNDVSLSEDGFLKLLQGAVALFVPFLTTVSQGFFFPKYRKLMALRHLLRKRDLGNNIHDEELKTIIDR